MKGRAESPWILFLVGVAAAPGCSALGAATGGVQQATSATQQTTATADAAKQTAGDTADKAKKTGDEAKGLKGGGAGKGGKCPDPDCDGTRGFASEGKLNTPTNDALDPKKGDSVDWRFFDVGGKGRATAQLAWDTASADLFLGVYDAFGENLAESPPRGPAPSHKVLVMLPRPGRYYLKVQSLKGATEYTVALFFDGPGAGAPVAAGGAGGGSSGGPASGGRSAPPAPAPATGGSAPGEIPNPAAGGAGSAPAGGPAPAAGGPALPAPDDPNHPRAKIVQTFRDQDGTLVLYIDKGSAAGVKVGLTGYILAGKDDKKLDGGDFRITQVIDATRSVAKAAVTRVGANNRCIIDLVK